MAPTSGRSCTHEAFRAGCLFCGIRNAKSGLERAQKEVKNCEDSILLYSAMLKKRNISDGEYSRLQNKLESAQEHREQWSKRAHALREGLNAAKHQAAPTTPDAIEASTLERDELVKQRFKTMFDGAIPQYTVEDPSRQPSSVALDRSNIPATPDSLLQQADGLQVFLHGCRQTHGGLPIKAIGPQATGPIIMNYGRALAMFGPNDMPSNQAREDHVHNLAAFMSSQLNLVDEPDQTTTAADPTVEESQPRTEYEFRCKYDNNYPCPPQLDEGEQWKLLKANRYLAYCPLLMKMYIAYVEDRERQRREAGPDGQDDQDAEQPTHPINVVEDLTWNGFTNWVHHCTVHIPDYRKKVVPAMVARRDERDGLKSILWEWTPPSVIPLYNDPGFKRFYSHKTLLGQVDANIIMAKDKRDRRRHRQQAALGI